MTKKQILCTGGAGYIGSHTVIHLLLSGYDVTVLDNLSNSSEKMLDRLQEICGKPVTFKNIDLVDKVAVDKLFDEVKFDAVVHYAALKAVGESVAQPLRYYRNNIVGTLNLLEAMDRSGCKVMVFSSSATVYQPTDKLIKESDALGPSNPYGQTKVMIEQILRDVHVADPTWKISLLRYFNPVGAHPSGKIGESPDHPLNLLPYIQQVAVGRREHLTVFGNDWPTRDGTGVRDYIHVEDLAEGHIAALAKLFSNESGVLMIHNLGTQKGVSVLELAALFEKASGKKIPIHIGPRRPGDLASVVADSAKAEQELGWKAKRTIEEACASAWKWQSQNPYGFSEAK